MKGWDYFILKEWNGDLNERIWIGFFLEKEEVVAGLGKFWRDFGDFCIMVLL